MRRPAVQATGLALVIAIAAGASGCRGSDGDAVTRAEWARRADAICTAERAKVAAIRRPGGLADLGRYLGRVTPLLDRQRRDVGRLRAAEADEEAVSRLLARWDDVLAALRGARAAAETDDDVRIVLALRQAAARDGQAAGVARGLGLRACRRFNPVPR